MLCPVEGQTIVRCSILGRGISAVAPGAGAKSSIDGHLTHRLLDDHLPTWVKSGPTDSQRTTHSKRLQGAQSPQNPHYKSSSGDVQPSFEKPAHSASLLPPNKTKSRIAEVRNPKLCFALGRPKAESSKGAWVPPLSHSLNRILERGVLHRQGK